MRSSNLDPKNINLGVVGIGLMGSSIIVSLLIAGHPVVAVAPIESDFHQAKEKITEQLEICARAGLFAGKVQHCLNRLKLTQNYNDLSDCDLVMECVIEDMNIKSKVYHLITAAVADSCIIASNTSAIAITLLQKMVKNPKRFLGIHWAEPAYATRFMEITCGDETDSEYADWVFNLAHYWAKEPTLLRKDIRGFITNRLMYAVYREVFTLVANGQITLEDADKAFRYDVGSWITLMGLFRRIDYLGIKDYAEIFRNVFPVLSNSEEVPAVMQEIVAANGRGIQNQHGLFPYTPKEALAWKKAFAAFNDDIFRLAAQYPDQAKEKLKILI
jgi:3-hydroxybutyryl-CoA dehydrogenase